ncbi:Hypothetical predicted protein [Scomber scombrus]|uniref:Uncharacterized protein n=1 Tax=Scomber scombrus TaxID=13677 RepID=A0AAV1Q0F7_SCOSC
MLGARSSGGSFWCHVNAEETRQAAGDDGALVKIGGFRCKLALKYDFNVFELNVFEALKDLSEIFSEVLRIGVTDDFFGVSHDSHVVVLVPVKSAV